jgi:hypothetical protein
MYNLLIINSGNRPAVNVCLDLKLSDEDFGKCITQEIDNPGVEAILKCFNIEGAIPLLIDGDKRSNYFGLTSSKSEDNIWRYGRGASHFRKNMLRGCMKVLSLSNKQWDDGCLSRPAIEPFAQAAL